MIFEEFWQHHLPEIKTAYFAYATHHPEYVDTEANARLVLEHINKYSLPVTEQSIADTVQAHVKAGHPMLLSATDLALQQARLSLGTAYELFTHWWSYQHVDRTPRAEIAVINECKGHQIDKSFLDQALGRASSKGLVTHLQNVGQDAYIPGIHSSNPKLQSDSVDVVYDALGHRIYSKDAPTRTPSLAAQQYTAKLEREAAAGRGTSETMAQKEAKLERLRNSANTHSQRAELHRISASNPITKQFDIDATIKLLEAVIAQQGSR